MPTAENMTDEERARIALRNALAERAKDWGGPATRSIERRERIAAEVARVEVGGEAVEVAVKADDGPLEEHFESLYLAVRATDPRESDRLWNKYAPAYSRR